MTGGRFSTYEIDFLDYNFQGSPAMTEDVYAADRWYSGMARAATERGIAIQYCLCAASSRSPDLGDPTLGSPRRLHHVPYCPVPYCPVPYLPAHPELGTETALHRRPSATDMLVSLPYPSVVQARASGDYVSTEANVGQLGGSSLLMGAVGIAPSKDTLWTRSPQPPTVSLSSSNAAHATLQSHSSL